MFLREAPAQTLTDLLDLVETDHLSTLTLSPDEVHVDIPGHQITLGTTEIPMTSEGLKTFGATLDIPTAFLLRQDPDLQQVLVTRLLSRQSGNAVYSYAEDGLHEIRDPRVEVISPSRLLHIAARVR